MSDIDHLMDVPVAFLVNLSIANRENYICEDGKIVRVESK